MASVNKVTLLGRIGKDPELKQFDNGNKAVRFSMATSETWKDKTTGEKKEQTEWHNCVAWGPIAGVIANYVKKGHLLYVAGKITTRSWEQNGERKFMTEIVVDEIQLLTPRESSGTAQSSPYASQYASGGATAAPSTPSPTAAPDPWGQSGGQNVDNKSGQPSDDLPF